MAKETVETHRRLRDPFQNSKTTITTLASPFEAGRVFALGDDEFGQCAGSGSDSPSLRSDFRGQ